MKGAGFEFLRVILSLLNIHTDPKMAILVTSCSLKLLPIGLLWSYYHSLASAETVSYNPKSEQWMIFKSHEKKKK